MPPQKGIMSSLAIVGTGYAFWSSPKLELKNKDVWAFNAGATHYPITAAFQMHKPEGYISNGEKYLTWLSNLTVPVYMREVHPEFPTSIAYPFEEIFAMTKHVFQGTRKWEELIFFTSSVSMAIALAILQNRTKIDIYGVELVDKKEYIDQRECFSFWIGFAAGRNISLDIHCADSIFKKPIYGS